MLMMILRMIILNGDDVDLDVDQGGIKCGNRGTEFLDSKGSHR